MEFVAYLQKLNLAEIYGPSSVINYEQLMLYVTL